MNRDHLDHDQAPPHPGEILREDILPALAMSRTALARHLGISISRLSSLLAEGRPVTLDLAVRLGAALGQGSRYWLGLQVQHDIWRAEQAMPASVTPVRWPPRRRHGADVIGPLVPLD